MNETIKAAISSFRPALLLIFFAFLISTASEEIWAKKGDPLPPSVTCNCYNPPFITNQSKPNVLVILDNSNSMDEDFYGGAVGSFSTASKSEVARSVLRDLITQMKDMLRVGIMTYKLPTDVQASYIHNSHYFASYDVRSWCPGTPPDECRQYCENHGVYSWIKNACENYCKGRNPFFDINLWVDQIVKTYGWGADDGPYLWNSDARVKYCHLTYPKTSSQPNPQHPEDNNSTIYYKYSAPFYAASDLGTGFCYATSYDPLENTSDTYACYSDKVGSSDFNSGYSNLLFTASFLPTDSDYALGYLDFGRRVNWYSVGPAWYSTSTTYTTTPSGMGYLHVPVADLTDANGTLTSTYTSDMTKLTLMDGNTTRYMSCSATDKNSCSTIVNAGLTPTAGTLQLAYNYFKGLIWGTPSPIESVCQKNFVIYITDGLPNVSEAGTKSTASSLKAEVLTKIYNLRTLTATVGSETNRRGVKTYVLGMGLTPEAKAYVDEMADYGNTTIPGGHAYYGDDPVQFANALSDIFGNIVHTATAATSVSILSEKTRQGANLIQAVFYPMRALDAGGNKGTWLGYLYNYWMHISKTTTTMREDTIQDFILNLTNDYVLEFSHNDLTGVVVDRYRDTNGDGNIDANETVAAHIDTVTLDDTKPLWEAGKVLSRRNPRERTIYTVVNTPSSGAVSGPLVPFNDGNSSSFVSLLGSPLTFDACLGEDNATRRSRVYPSCSDDNCTRTNNLINYVRGSDARNVGLNRACRNRTFSADGGQHTWKLGDIVYSTPKDVIDYMFCYNSSSGFDSTTCTQNKDCPTGKVCRKKESVIFTGANDGMLHAFKTGIIMNEPNAPTVASLSPPGATDFGKELWAFIPKNTLPYLRWLAAPGYCHLAYVDLSPYIVNMKTDRGIRKVLIGGMRLGGAPASGIGTAQPPPSDTCPSVSCSTITTCYNPSGCIGLSSYYALDITNPEQPAFLWEFSHPNLGYSYSGPAVLTRNGKYYLMFLSGPTGFDGSSSQNLYAFTLTINPQNSLDTRNPKFGIDMIESLDVWTSGSNIKNAIGGRLFTTGLDINGDGNTDFVFFGESDTPSGKLSALKGGVVSVYIDDNDPGNWNFTESFLNLAKQPITAKVETAKCFDGWYLFLGSGRYFTPTDAYPSQRDFILSVPFYCTNTSDPSTCVHNVNYVHGSAESVCTDLTTTTKTHQSWLIDLDDANGTLYLKERLITDPTVSSQNTVFFTTTQPVGPGKPCESGGHTRVWGLNCATGQGIYDTSCAAAPITDPTGTIYLQTSTGAISKILVADAFTDKSGRATPWIEGIPPESSTPFVGRFRTRRAQVFHWIEK